MKKISKALWGVALIAAGVLLALRGVGVLDFEIFFDGWWTLFLIVPCGVHLFTEQDKLGNLIGLTVGILLLLCCQDVLDFDLFWKLIPAAIVAVIGVKLILSALRSGNTAKILEASKEEGAEMKEICATFSENKVNFDGQVFDGAELTAVFGAVKCDLRHAIIEKDCAIKATAVFGGIDILVPENVNVRMESTAIFGGAENKAATGGGAVTLYVGGTCLFGGVTVK